MTKYRNPLPTVDVVLLMEGGVVLIERKNPPLGWALPGGFVDEGESYERAAIRECKEETGLDASLTEQFYTYSAPGRDPRFHTATTIYLAKAEGEPVGGDDAAQARIWPLDALPPLCFDHLRIIEDVRRYLATGVRPGVANP